MGGVYYVRHGHNWFRGCCSKPPWGPASKARGYKSEEEAERDSKSWMAEQGLSHFEMYIVMTEA